VNFVYLSTTCRWNKYVGHPCYHSGQNVRWPYRMLPLGKSRRVCRRDRQTDGRQTVTIPFPTDKASVLKIIIISTVTLCTLAPVRKIRATIRPSFAHSFADCSKDIRRIYDWTAGMNRYHARQCCHFYQILSNNINFFKLLCST